MAEQRSQAPPEEEKITFSDYNLETVSNTTTWMRTVSSLQMFFGILLILFLALLLVLGGKALLKSTSGLVLVAVLGGKVLVLLLGAGLLRQSCVAFYDGVLSDSETPLAVGFRKLRTYLLLYGLFGLTGLTFTILKIVL